MQKEQDRVAQESALAAAGGLASRCLYARAANPESALPGPFVDAVRAELQWLAAKAPEPGRSAVCELSIASWSAEEASRYRNLWAAESACADRQVLARRAALGCAPLSLVSGGWLQWLSCAGNADDPAVLRSLALYAADVGVGQPGASRGAAYLALLRNLRLSKSAVPAARIALDHRVADWSFYLPAIMLTMSRRPDDFTPEILGADLCLRTAGLLPPLTLVRQAYPAAADWTAIDPSSARSSSGSPGAELCRAAVASLTAAASEDVARRVAMGFSWASAALQCWSSQLHADLDAARDPAVEMAELLRQRAREGSSYHQNFQLSGRPLSQWLSDSRTNPAPLLDALARSKLVKPGRSDASALVGALVREPGPMFRVFAPEDLSVIRRWIDSLPANAPAGRRDPSGTACQPGEPPLAWVSVPPGGPAHQDDAPSSVRAAYHQLQRRTGTPALADFARDYVHNWLARAHLAIDEGATRLPARWDSAGLRPWLADQHDRHGQDFRLTSAEPIQGREELIDSTVQLAPLTLIDGSWLQGFTDYEQATSEFGHFLFETYWDELGNGEPQLNHPLIYRELLAEMGLRLPPTASAEFAEWPGFKDHSFELPVYWLSIGRFPQSFLPEVLGLNLAMELSGVGGTYRRAHIALKKHGFSTRFVDIHNTIDNVATGHSAWAADAVDAYMATVASSYGTGAQAQVWDRVRTGFRSLNVPQGKRARRQGRRAQRASRRR